MRPTRRPRNRIRENANAASSDRNMPAAADSPAIRIELTYQCPNEVLLNRLVKFAKLAPDGTSCVEDSVPTGLNAAEITNTIGNSENTIAIAPTTCRQPTSRSHLRSRRGARVCTVTCTPPPACG